MDKSGEKRKGKMWILWKFTESNIVFVQCAWLTLRNGKKLILYERGRKRLNKFLLSATISKIISQAKVSAGIYGISVVHAADTRKRTVLTGTSAG